MDKLFFSLGIIACGLTIGYLMQRMVERGALRLPWSLGALRKALQKMALLFFLPITMLGAIWIVDVPSLSIAALPVIAVGAISLGGLLALAAARLFRLAPRQTGALFPCGAFTNIGAIGALVCFIFLGEKGFALVPIYKLFEEVTYYSVGFPIAKYFSAIDGPRDDARVRLKTLARDPFILTALTAIAIGGGLNLAGVPRPSGFSTVNAVFIPLGTGLLLISIGLAMRFSRVRFYLRECVAVALIKFLCVPLAATLAAYGLGFDAIEGGLPLKVVMILSSMPVAFNALIPPSIYDLDLDLANACWFFTNAALVMVLPMLLVMLRAV